MERLAATGPHWVLKAASMVGPKSAAMTAMVATAAAAWNQGFMNSSGTAASVDLAAAEAAAVVFAVASDAAAFLSAFSSAYIPRGS